MFIEISTKFQWHEIVHNMIVKIHFIQKNCTNIFIDGCFKKQILTFFEFCNMHIKSINFEFCITEDYLNQSNCLKERFDIAKTIAGMLLTETNLLAKYFPIQQSCMKKCLL